MKNSQLGISGRFSSAALVLLWLSSTEHQAWGFSPVSPAVGRTKAAHTVARTGIDSPARGETKVFMGTEPTPDPWKIFDHPEDEISMKYEMDTNDIEEDANANESKISLKEKPTREPYNPQSVVMQSLRKFVEGMKDRTAAVAFAAMLFASTLNPDPAFAAMSGGRMGGSYPSMRSSPAPTVMAPSRSYSSYSRGYSSGFSSGYLSSPSAYYYRPRPSVYVSPIVSPFSTFSTFSPFYSPSYAYSSPGVMVGTRGPGLLQFLAFGAVALAVSNAVSSFGNGVANNSFFEDKRGNVSGALGPGVSVAEISVALEVPRRDDPSSILSALDRISRTARTDSRVGIQNLTSQVALELLRRKSSIVSASTKYNHYNNRERAQREFNNVAIKERAKFERETVSRYGGVDYTPSKSNSLGSSPSQATMAVVTLLVAIEGDSTKVPKIRSAQDVEEALRRIASDSKVDSCLQSAEILWTPEDRSETLTNRDVVADYPSLRSI